MALGSQCTEDEVGEVLQTHDSEKLDQYWDRLVSRLQDAQGRLTQMHQSRGEMNQEMKTLAEDRLLAEAKLQLGCVDEQIRQAVRRWRVLAVTALMLEAIRQIYETERQPETLSEASQYLERFTEGKYLRIWTPLSSDVLRVDAADGQSMPLDLLSQGTREAVFLSLRLALSAAYSRRGAVLPLVLDDVMVNFDLRRAKAAAVVLRDFANAGHQMLMFTCHQHIMQIFEAASVEVRLLPVRNGVDGFDWYDETVGPRQKAVQIEPEEDAEVPLAPLAAAEPQQAPAEEESPAFESQWEPIAAEAEEDVAEEEVLEEIQNESGDELEGEEPDVEEYEEDDAPDRSQWLEAGLADAEDDDAAGASWDPDDELKLADENRQPALAGSGSDNGSKPRWWEDEEAA